MRTSDSALGVFFFPQAFIIYLWLQYRNFNLLLLTDLFSISSLLSLLQLLCSFTFLSITVLKHLDYVARHPMSVSAHGPSFCGVLHNCR